MNQDVSIPKQPELDREIATISGGRDITRGYLGPLLITQDQLLIARGTQDLLLYENVKSDPVVQSVMQQRRLAVVKCEWKVDPASTAAVDKKAADLVRQQLTNIGWDRVTGLMHWGMFYGYAVAEILYGRYGRYVTIDAIKVRNRRRFRFDHEQNLRLLTFENMIEGVPALAPYFWHFANGADHDDEPYGMGLAHWLYWPVLFKRNGLKFWMIFLEKFGMPTAKGTYPSSATPAEKSALLAATSAIQTDSGVILPEGMALELLEAARSGSADYKGLVEMMDETIAKVTVGQQASTAGTAGRLGEEKLQSEVRRELVKADSDLICESFNLGPVRWLTQWNFPDAQPPRVYRDVGEPEDLEKISNRDKSIFSMGFKPSLQYILDTYGGEWKETRTPPPDGNADPLAAVGDAASFAQGGDPLDPPALQAALVARAIDPALQQWIDSIHTLVDKSESLDQVREGLLALMPDMSLDHYTKAMQQALAAAALAGRYEILREAGV